jgi:hypothetical protein
VYLEAEVTTAADQVAERTRAEFVLGHRDSLVDDERRAAGMLEQVLAAGFFDHRSAAVDDDASAG